MFLWTNNSFVIEDKSFPASKSSNDGLFSSCKTFHFALLANIYSPLYQLLLYSINRRLHFCYLMFYFFVVSDDRSGDFLSPLFSSAVSISCLLNKFSNFLFFLFYDLFSRYTLNYLTLFAI